MKRYIPITILFLLMPIVAFSFPPCAPTDLASPGAIGGTTPAAGHFTTMDTTGNVGINTVTPSGSLHTVLSAGSPMLIGGDTIATLTGVSISDANPSVLTLDATIDDGLAAGDAVIVNSGTNATVGTYIVVSIVANTSVTLNRQAATGACIDGNITYVNDAIIIESGSSGGKPKITLPVMAGSPADVSLSWGGGSGGIFEYINQSINIKPDLGGLWRFDNAGITENGTGSSSWKAELTSATNPIFIPGGDADTGLGAAGADQLSLIAGGVEGIRITEATPLMSYQKMPIDGTCGGYIERVFYATSGALTGATDKIELNIPTGWVIKACQLHVKTAVVDSAGDDTWSSELNDTGQEEVISAASAAAQNTNVNHFAHADAGYGGTLTDAETDILLTPQGGNFSSGEIEAHCIAFGFDAWDAE